jgi:hypothetical protein
MVKKDLLQNLAPMVFFASYLTTIRVLFNFCSVKTKFRKRKSRSFLSRRRLPALLHLSQ